MRILGAPEFLQAMETDNSGFNSVLIPSYMAITLNPSLFICKVLINTIEIALFGFLEMYIEIVHVKCLVKYLIHRCSVCKLLWALFGKHPKVNFWEASLRPAILANCADHWNWHPGQHPLPCLSNSALSPSKCICILAGFEYRLLLKLNLPQDDTH